MLESGFEGIRTYITRMQNMVAQYIATWPILYLYERSTRRLGARVFWRWWEKEDSWHGLPPMPGGRDPVGGSVQATYAGRGTFLL